MRFVSLLAAGLLGCATSYRTTLTTVRQALLAQWEGGGGCLQLDTVRPLAVPFFSGVRFFEATCILEHGDTAVSAVADDGTLVYLLDNPSSYQLLVDRHPAHGVDSGSATTFAALLARFTGRLTMPARVIGSLSELPDSVRRVIEAKGWDLMPTGVEGDPPKLNRVWFTSYSGWSVLTFDVLLSPDGGGVAMVDTVWTAADGVR